MLLSNLKKALLVSIVLLALGSFKEMKAVQATTMPKVVNLTYAVTKTGVMPKLEMTLDSNELGSIRIQYRIDFLDEEKDLVDSNMRLLSIKGITNYSTYLKSFTEPNDYYYIQVEFIYQSEIFGNYELKIESTSSEEYILSGDDSSINEEVQIKILEDETTTIVYQHFDFKTLLDGNEYLLPIINLEDMSFSMSCDDDTISLREMTYTSANLLFSDGFAGSDFVFEDDYYHVPVVLSKEDEIISIKLASQGYFDLEKKAMVSKENYFTNPIDNLICSLSNDSNDIQAKLVISEFGINMSDFELLFDIMIDYAFIGKENSYFIINEIEPRKVDYELESAS